MNATPNSSPNNGVINTTSFAQHESAKIGQWNLTGALLFYQKEHLKLRATLLAISLSALLTLTLVMPWYVAILTGCITSIAGLYLFRLYLAHKSLKKFNIPLVGDFKEQFIRTSQFPSMNEEEKETLFNFINRQMKDKPQLQKYNFFTMNYDKSGKYLDVLLTYDEFMCLMNWRRKEEAKKQQLLNTPHQR